MTNEEIEMNCICCGKLMIASHRKFCFDCMKKRKKEKQLSKVTNLGVTIG